MKVIIDASNVAHYGKRADDKPRLKNISSSIEALKKLGYEVIIIADASLRHEIDEKESFNQLLDDGKVQQVPSGTTADHYILKLAEEEDAKILSNDVFREYFDEFQDINSRRIPYQLKDGEIEIGSSSKPKKVKNILQKISSDILYDFEKKNVDSYRTKRGKKLSGIAVAKEVIDRINRSQEEGIEPKLEGLLMKLPLFEKVMNMVEEAEKTSNFIIFVLVHPRDYRDAVKYAGNIAVTVGDRLKLDHAPLVAVRNDLFTKAGSFELNIIYSDEVVEESPYNVNITINDHDYSFVKKNSRNIASTVAARIGTWKFPIVSVKPSMLMEKPGQYEIILEKGGTD
ncbi:Zc3h12a-like ribonuclease [Methanobacterium alkalithermotolerans]|uniref:Zc3h12a-like ribonuclease n=1 Tax=Methanobacterium alkalithermotolerans TaxID=2731220 RepID=A0A8T8KFN3_9EURY|nr:Zc3h12a-like ribonuclease [Methanobacterium alkalithermotolerans]QUH24091.1 Zc3h12a-like ribonuclease [Methanobacterium alkalithermotolerans]